MEHAELTTEPLIRLKQVHKAFDRGNEVVPVLQSIDLELEEGSYVSFMGPSGSGKSTLLYLIAGLDRPTSGTIFVGDSEISKMREGELAGFRAANVGFVFQAYNLIPTLTAQKNVELPLTLTDLSRSERRERAATALRVVGLEERANHYPRQLSGGQEQRVAIARAIVTDPRIIVADEPTGDLDRKSADDVLDMLSKLHGEFGKTIIMVTHDPAAAERAQIQHRLDKGRLD